MESNTYKKIEWFWNLIHYFCYRFDCWGYYLIARLVYPVTHFILNKIFRIKKFNSFELGYKAYADPEKGIAPIFAAWITYLLWVFVLGGTYALCMLIPSVLRSMYVVYILIFLSYLANHFILFRKDRYLRFFKEFDKMQKNERTRWKWIVFVFVLVALSYFIGSIVLFFKFK